MVERIISKALCQDDKHFWVSFGSDGAYWIWQAAQRIYLELQPHSKPDDIGVNDTWYDEVDLSLCFEDTAMSKYFEEQTELSKRVQVLHDKTPCYKTRILTTEQLD